ncbi:MAG: dioxygenase [Actinomycetia bacterium]|nr:dioxygenase [Actinomycetes bacterium]
MTSTHATQPMPSIFLSHGAPPLADDVLWTEELSTWAGDLPRPSSILVVSAHWEAAPLTISATETVPLFYDFYGFAQRYYEVEYAAPGAPQLAASVAKLLASPGRNVYQDPERGLDHGAYVPLVEMYPDADIPVLQVSMPTLDPWSLFELGRKLAPLRDEGVLILGSGFSTHNLSEMNLGAPDTSEPPTWSSEFDDWLDRTLAAGDIDALIDFQNKAPAAVLAHPRTEHFAPLFVALGAAIDDVPSIDTTIDGFWYGLSKRSIQIV